MQARDHWGKVYSTKATDAVSWFQPHADFSVGLIRAAGVGCDAAIIDVGGGASTLVDDLLVKANLPANRFDVWHDRAVFNFLVTPEDRAAHVQAVFHSVKPGGHVIVATFAEDSRSWRWDKHSMGDWTASVPDACCLMSIPPGALIRCLR